jgi:photosystem II stability/assembly factor-like uncharacterized protein
MHLLLRLRGTPHRHYLITRVRTPSITDRHCQPMTARRLSIAWCLALLTGALGGPGAASAQRQAGHGDAPYPTALFGGLRYRMIGPSRGGRVTAVAGHADQPATFYMGATGGGVWKSIDYGRSWRNVSDRYFATGSIGAIRVADADTNIVWVGTGSDGLRSNVITGRGVYRSTDGGETWAFAGLRNAGQIGAILIHPDHPDVVYVAAIGQAFGPNETRGVFRTRDGGATWKRVLFVSDSTGAVDLEFAPDDPRQIYGAMWRGERKPWTIISGAREGGIYRSLDGGDTWERLGGGLPDELVGKSDLAVSPADPKRLYVLMEADPGGGLYRSDDRGATFSLVSAREGLLHRPFYYTNVDADPTDADVVYVSNEDFFKSTDGGQTFRTLSTPHGDNHDLWINPRNPALFVQSNDGGANVTRDGGRTWSTQHNQPTAELYQVDVDDRFPYWAYGGQQDNSTIAVPSLPPFGAPGGHTAHWRAIGGCETGPVVPKPGEPNIVYANCKGRFGRYSRATGQEQQYAVGAQYMYGHNPRDLLLRFQRVAPIEISPHDPGVIYHASQYLHRTTDEGRTWETISPDLTANESGKQVISGGPITRDITGEEFYSAIYAVEESPHEPGVIWVGANDGPVHLTRDSGATWWEVTPPDLPPGGRVQAIELSPHRPGKAYIAVHRYQLGDWEPYLYRTADYGTTWTRLTTGANGIPPDHPTRVVREDPDREGLLYAGTEFGMFVSFDDGATWQSFQLNLPATPVTDIALHRGDLVLSTMGRSFWILDNLTPLHQLTEAVARPSAHLFQPRAAYRVRYQAAGYRGRLPGEPRYPPPGAMIDYYLADDATGGIMLEILDSAGVVIRSFESAGGAVPGLGTGPDSRGFDLEASAGMHRFIWDLRYPPAWGAEEREAGPLAPPGRYRVRLTAGTWRVEQPLEVRMDPRVAADGVTPRDLTQQLALSLEIRDALGAARQIAARIDSACSALEGAAAGPAGARRSQAALRDRLTALRADLVTAEGRYQQPMLIDQLRYLYDMLQQADQPPGRDTRGRAFTLQRELDGIRRRLETALAQRRPR